MRSLSNSWALMKASARVLALDKELVVFPLLSGVSALLVTATFALPLVLSGGWEIFADDGSTSYLGMAVAFAFYLVNYFVIFFFNTALVGAALIRMDGGDPTVSDGLSLAWGKLGTILGYAAIAATVGMLLRALSERLGFVGKFVVGLVGMAWTLATYLTVPVLVSQDVSAVDAVKQSADLFKRTWGEQVVANFGLGWAGFLMAGSWTAVTVLLVVVASPLGPPAVIPAVIVGAVGYLALALIMSALKGIYVAALYRYATAGDTGIFDPEVIQSAFRRR